MTVLDHIAPYPKTATEATAEVMAAHFAALAQMSGRVAVEHPDTARRSDAYHDLGEYYALAFFLRELAQNAGASIADRVAKDLWCEWQDGTHIALDLAEWLREYGVQIELVNAVARATVAEAAHNATAQAVPVGGA